MRLNFINLSKEILSRMPLESPNFDKIAFLSFHDLKEDYHPWFLDLIEKINTEFGLLDPSLLISARKHELKHKSGVFLTFDDGFLSSFTLAAEIKKRFGVPSILFICEDFLNLNRAQAINFLTNQLFKSNVDLSRVAPVDVMNDDHIRSLIRNGHIIGCHSKSHKMLSSLKMEDDLIDETLHSKLRLEEKFGTSISLFAYPFGSFESISKSAIDIVGQNFDLGFVNIRGRHNQVDLMSGSPLIFRNNVVTGEPYRWVRAAIRGRFDIFKTIKRQSRSAIQRRLMIET